MLTYANPAVRVGGAAGEDLLDGRITRRNSQKVFEPQACRLDLYISGGKTGVVVEPDLVWLGMWRVRRGTDLSDLTNISRAKDAAITWARPRGLGGSEVAQWHRRETGVGASRSFFGIAERSR